MEQQSITGIFGDHLTELFRERGVKPGQVAERAGLSQVVMADLIAGRQILTADLAFVLADPLELSPLVLLELQRESCLEARDGSRARRELKPILAA